MCTCIHLIGLEAKVIGLSSLKIFLRYPQGLVTSAAPAGIVDLTLDQVILRSYKTQLENNMMNPPCFHYSKYQTPEY